VADLDHCTGVSRGGCCGRSRWGCRSRFFFFTASNQQGRRSQYRQSTFHFELHKNSQDGKNNECVNVMFSAQDNSAVLGPPT
jgi:hypothetical protein